MSSAGTQLSVKQMIENMKKVLGVHAVSEDEHTNDAGVKDGASDGKDNDEGIGAKRAKRSLKVDEMIGRLLMHTTVCDELKEECVI